MTLSLIDILLPIITLFKGMPPEGKKTDLEGRYALLSIRSETPSAGVTNSNNEETGQKNYAAFLRLLLYS